MKHLIIITSIFFCFVTPLAAQDNEVKTVYKLWLEGDESVLIGGWEYDGRNYQYNLKMEDFKGTPKWESSVGKVPLSPEDALRIASSGLKELVEDLKPWTVFKIELLKLPGGGDAWYYNVTFTYTASDRRGTTFDIVVRLDGKAIPPRLNPKSPLTKPQP